MTRCRVVSLTLPFLACAAPAMADIPPPGRTSFLSGNGRFELRLSTPLGANPERWELVERRSGIVRYLVVDELAAKRVYVSDDGGGIAVLDSLCDGEPSLDHRVLDFLRDGRVTRSHTLRDFVPDLRYVDRSVSYWVWTLEESPGMGSLPQKQPSPDGTIAFTTFDLRRHTFDVGTGRRVDVSCASTVPHDSIVLSGAIRLVTPAIPGVTPRRFAVTPNGAMCDTVPPAEEVSFEVSPGFVAPQGMEWLTDDATLPSDEHGGAVFLRDGKLVGAHGFMLGPKR